MQYTAEYDDNLIKKMAELGEKNYGSINSISDADFLKWQLLDNPAGKGIAVVAVEEETKNVIGESMQMPRTLRAFGEKATATTFVNTLIDRESRSLQTFHNIHKMSLEKAAAGAQVAYALPNPNSYALFGKLYDFKTIGDIPLLIIPMRPKALIKSRFSEFLAKLTPDVSYWGTGDDVFAVRITAAELTENNRSAFDTFWDKVKDKYPIMGVRNFEYIKWRYMNVPMKAYKIFVAWERRRIIGFAVVINQEIEGIKNGMVVEFLVESGRKDAAMILLQRCRKYFSKRCTQLIGTLMLPTCNEYKYLKQFGFLVCPQQFLPQPFHFIIKTLSTDSGDKFEDIRNWYFTMGDYDAV